MIFTIDLIEGNSHIGVPVFSNSAKKENKNYMVFSQPKAPKKHQESDEEDDRKRRELEGKSGTTGMDPKSQDRVSSLLSAKYAFLAVNIAKNKRSREITVENSGSCLVAVRLTRCSSSSIESTPYA